MKISDSTLLRRLPAWGTCVAGLSTLVLLFRMLRFQAATDLAVFAASCALELVLLDLATRLTLRLRFVPLRILMLVLPALAGCIYMAQLYSIWISGGLIPPIAFANQEVVGLIAFDGIYALLAVFLTAFIGHACVVRTTYKPLSRRITAVVILVLGTGYATLLAIQPLARGIVVARGEAPISSFLRSAATSAGMSGQVQLSAAELIEARAEFSRRTVYQQGFPEAFTHALPERPNVIVIFTEGMSARWMDTYGSRHPGVTPNLDRLAGGSLVFSNYYNHTAATFRGLRGQLTSGHQEVDGYNQEGTGIGQRDVSDDITAISRISIPEVLRAQGYRSMFFLSQQEYLNKMVETLGFDRVLGRDYLYDHYLSGGGEGERPKYLSDSALFDTMLTELESQPHDQPFFAAAYNFQTHAFLEGEYAYAGGDNPLLNRFHTYDRDLGRFIDRFMASRLHENTLLVFTADHSTFPGPNAVRADDRVHGYFVDTIPLLMYWKGAEHRMIDVAGKNSLDLAPSLISLLGVKKAHNLFLGCTFFEKCAVDKVSNLGAEYILTDGDGSYSEYYVPPSQKTYYEESKRVIERYKSMDMVIDVD